MCSWNTDTPLTLNYLTCQGIGIIGVWNLWGKAFPVIGCKVVGYRLTFAEQYSRTYSKGLHWKYCTLNVSRTMHDHTDSWLVGCIEDLRRFSGISATWKQEITNLWKLKWRGRESNPRPLAPQAKSLTTWPPLLPIQTGRWSKFNVLNNECSQTLQAKGKIFYV